MRNVQASPRSSGAAKMVKQVHPSQEDEIQDLCSTCNHNIACTQRKTHRPPILFCEEFDDYIKPTLKAAPRPSEKKADARTYKGLCMNCEHRADCPQARTAAGIWHCEEYR